MIFCKDNAYLKLFQIDLLFLDYFINLTSFLLSKLFLIKKNIFHL